MTEVTRRGFLTGGAVVLGWSGLSRRVALAQGPASGGPPDPRLVEDLVAANHILVDQNVLDGYGHVSVRPVDPRGRTSYPERFILAR